MDIPPIIPDLTLLRRIGTGSYGDVWLARTLTGVYRAVKVIDRARFFDDRPFQRELEGVSRFQRAVGDQPRQLALMHVGRLESLGLLYYVMELADDVTAGTDIDPDTYEPLTLKSLRARRPILPAAEVVRLGVDLARGLAGLHAVGLIHRDVKPSNIILVNGVPKLADIGLVSSREVSVTSLGTPGYAPPEGSGSLSADLWGLGRILYELVTGLSTKEFPRLPHDFDQREDAGVLLELNEVVLRACEPDPQDRYATAQHMLDDLLLIQAGRSVKDLNRLRARLHLLARVGAVAAAIAGAVIAGLGVKNYFAMRTIAGQEAAARVAAERNERLAQYTSNLHVAQLALNREDFGVGRAALRREIPSNGSSDLRGLEWFALWNDARGNAERSFGAAGDPLVKAVSIQPAGELLLGLRGNSVGELLAWDVASGASRVLATQVRRLGGFIGDGGQAVVSMLDGTLRLLDATTGTLSAAQANDVIVIQSSTDGRTVLLGSPAAAPVQLQVWDVIGANTLATWTLPAESAGARIAHAALSEDGRFLAVQLETGARADPANEVLVWDTAAQSYGFRRSDLGRVAALAFAPDASALAVAADHQPLRILETAGGAVRRESGMSPAQPTVARFSPDGRWIAVGGLDGSIRVVGAGNGDLVALLRGHEGFVEALAWTGSTSQLYSGSADGTIQSWSIPPTERTVTREGFWRGNLGEPMIEPDGETAIVTGNDGRLQRIALNTLLPVGGTWDAVHAIGFRTEGLLALHADRELVVLDLDSGVVERTGLTIPGSSAAYTIAGSRDSDVVGVGQADGTVTFWDVAGRQMLLQDRRHAALVTSVALSANGNLGVSGDRAGRIWLWRPREARADREIPGNGLTVTKLALSPDGLRCVIFTREGGLIVWRLDQQQEEVRRFAHPQGGIAATFAGDNSRMISAGYDGMLLVWSVPDFRQLAALSFAAPDGRAVTIRSLALSEGRTLLAYTENGRLRRWDLQP